jgi:hypothetical protein
VISPLQRPLPTQDNTRHKHKTNIRALGGTQTHDPSNQAAKTYASDHAATGIGVVLFGDYFISDCNGKT